MVVFKAYDAEGETLQMNFVHNGLFVQIGTDHLHDNEMRDFTMSDHDADELIEFLQQFRLKN
jgi:hypothetical protein